MDVIFLDVDGVLNSNETPNITTDGFCGVEDIYLHYLNIIVNCTGAKVVLVSDWKDLWDKDINKCYSDGIYLINRLKEHEITIIDKTDDRSVGSDYSTGRGYGIKKYLKNHNDIENYVILDDVLFSDYDKELKKHLVLTNNGLNSENVDDAIKILSVMNSEVIYE